MQQSFLSRLFIALVFVLTARSFAQENAVKALPLTELAAVSKPGLAVTFSAGGKTDTRFARLVALEVSGGVAPTPFLPPGAFVARWEGAIQAPLRGDYSFQVQGVGSWKLTINAQPVLESAGAVPASVPGKAVQLNKGANPLVLEYTSPEKGDARVRLLWSAREIPLEPVPPAVFTHDVNAPAIRGGERARAGRLLFAQYRCAACHDGGPLLPSKGDGMPELAMDAPAIGEFGSRYREAWMAHWINDPHAIRPQTSMPRVFHSKPGEIDPRARDIAAYFATLGTPAEGKPLDPALVPEGGALFANLGCIACHTVPEFTGKDEHQRVPLGHLQAKWQAPALKEYLKAPEKNYALTRMPNFCLTDSEAERLTAFLLAGTQKEFVAGAAGDPAKGGQLLATSGCLNCHAGLPPSTTPTLATTLKNGWTKGCLAPEPAARGTAPDFVLSALQREALLAFAAEDWNSLRRDNSAEFAEREIANLRCTACHARDSEVSTWSKLEEEMLPLQAGAPVAENEGVPVAGTVVPPLTWLGEKLQPAWSAKFIAGEPLAKPRPWMIARMPGFPAYAARLAEGLFHQHSRLGDDIPELADKPAAITHGETLLGENGGFNCLSCHGVGERPPTAVFEAPGINLGYTPDRLRKGYFHRWVFHPLRIDPDTKMPRYADDDGKTPLTDLYEGVARDQFEAIWEYLHALKK